MRQCDSIFPFGTRISPQILLNDHEWYISLETPCFPVDSEFPRFGKSEKSTANYVSVVFAVVYNRTAVMSSICIISIVSNISSVRAIVRIIISVSPCDLVKFISSLM